MARPSSLISVISITIMMLVLSLGVVVFPQQEPHYGGTLRVAMPMEPETLDPQVSGNEGPYKIAMSTFDTLVYKDKDGEFRPGLAEAWSWNTEGTLYTFKLRPGVTFHDGTPCNAEAIAYNFDRVVDPSTKSRFAVSILGPYESSRAVDELTVEVRFKTPIAPSALLDSLSQAWLSIVSPTAAQKWGPDEFGRHPVGSGPFVFKEWTTGGRITLVRNEEYNWASPVFEHSGKAYFDQIVFIFVPEDATRAATLETGESDIVVHLAEEAVEILPTKGFRILSGDALGCPMIFWMNTRNPILSDIHVRQAILYAFDAELLASTIYKGCVGAVYGPLAPATWAYNPAVEEMYPFDPEEASKLLDEAGWIMNSKTGIREKNGTCLELDLYDMFDNRRGVFLQALLHDVGIKLNVHIVTGGVLWETYVKGTEAMASLWMSYSDPDILRIVGHSSSIDGGYNFSGYRDAELDQKLVDAIAEVDTSLRKQLYFEIQEMIMSKALMLPVSTLRMYNGLRPDIEGVQIDRGIFLMLFDAYFK